MNNLKRLLIPVIQRQRRYQRWRGYFRWHCVLAIIAASSVILAAGHTAWAVAVVGLLMVGVLVMEIRGTVRNRIDYQKLARDIETHHPELHTTLVTAVEQRPDPQTGQYNFLQQRVIDEAIAAYEQSQFAQTAPAADLTRLRLANFALLLGIGTCAWMHLQMPAKSSGPLTRSTAEQEKESSTTKATLKQVEPGNTEVERGTSLAVLAHFEGRAPAKAMLVIQPTHGATRRVELVKNLDDPILGASLPAVDGPFKYHVEFDGQKSDAFAVGVFEHPTLERADATLNYPAYTKLPARTVEDTRRLSAVEGTRLAYQFHLNKPVQQARLTGANDEVIELKVLPGQPRAELPPIALTQSKIWKLELTDAAGRPNKIAPSIEIAVYANKPPVIRVASPRGDQQVSPVEEVEFAAELEDDFGLTRFGLTYNINGGELKDIPLGQDAPGNAKTLAEHLLALETLAVKPDQLINWFFWAEDIGPDAQTRRAFSDMFFAEIRPFEEIFRQGQGNQSQQQQQQQQQQSPNQQTQELIKLQKQIINATWKVRRQPATLSKDAPVLLQSQQQAVAKAKAMLERAEDEKSKGFITAAIGHMERAVEHLQPAASDANELLTALAAEQAAYQSLLQLQKHEFEVSRKNQQQQQQSSQQNQQRSQRQQSQLDQLDLREQKNKYETQKQAQRLQEPKQREQLQMLNRLKDLAQRQDDLNEKLKELENALRAAKDAAEKKEIEKQLKSLRDEQRRNLEDLDELNQRMERPENRADTKQQRQQLQQTRQEMKQAAKQMQQGQLSQAVASGTRAQKDLKEMRDDLRKKASSQFAEQMRNMRQEARDLSQKQEEISRNLDEEAKKPQRPSLAESDNKKDLVKQLGDQQDKLEGLLKDMKDTVEKSELAEPLLNRKLYEAFREAHQKDTKKTLKAAATLLDGEENAFESFPFRRALTEIMRDNPDKTKFDDHLRQRNFRKATQTLSDQTKRELDQLKRGVEKAAESVLGNEAEALKFAEKQLGELSEALKNEKAEATGKPSAKPNESQPGKPSGEKPNETAGKQPSPKSPNEQEQPGKQAGKPGEQAGNPKPQPGKQPSSQASFLNQQFNDANSPITGGNHREWSDRLRDVEEAVDQQGVRERVAQVREDLRKMNSEFRRHSKEPEWDLLEQRILQPLDQIRREIAEELAKQDSDKALVPIDRDPVPGRFTDLVKRYYERLGEDPKE